MLIFETPFDEDDQYEASVRGWCGHAKVQLSDGTTYRVEFYDVGRLAQDLETEVEAGRVCVADVGMIVLTEVTFENMRNAVARLAAEGYFNHFKPIQKGSGEVGGDVK